jgi:SAM-dependent methyltransferase
MSWTDRDGTPVEVPEPPPTGSHYKAIGDFQQAAYERNAFARGTAQEAAHLWQVLRLSPGAVVLDVGCGTGRHVRAFAERGAWAVGVDLSAGLLRAGRGGRFVQADARRLPVRTAAVDAVVCLCQGGFGISPEGDLAVLGEIARVLRPGGRLALTAFSLAFAARFLGVDDAIDVRRDVVWSRAEVRGADDERRSFDLWTTAWSARHLGAALAAAGLDLETLSGVQPGHYGHGAPTIMDPELLAIASRP